MILDSGFDGDDTFYSWMLIGLIGIDRIDWCSFSLDSSGKHFMYVLDKNILTVNPMGTLYQSDELSPFELIFQFVLLLYYIATCLGLGEGLARKIV